MKLRISHSTRYRYLAPAHTSSNDLRLTPPDNPWQKIHFFILKILPTTRLKNFQDLYGNTVSHFEIEEPHSFLNIETNFSVTTKDGYSEGLPSDVPTSQLANSQEFEELAPFLQPTRLIQIPPQIWRAAVDLMAENSDVFSLAKAIMHFVYSTSQYTPGLTSVSTTSAEFFEDRRGVCQDYANLMLALCRSIHLPARYVCGYLYDEKRKDIRGAHATHAWVDVWIPGKGWFGMDPTHNCLTKETYVTLAVGRDYHDVAPVTGSYWGGGGVEMTVKVHIEPA